MLLRQIPVLQDSQQFVLIASLICHVIFLFLGYTFKQVIAVNIYVGIYYKRLHYYAVLTEDNVISQLPTWNV